MIFTVFLKDGSMYSYDSEKFGQIFKEFELIKKYKQELIEYTNIESAPDEMAVLDNILFRFWQMGWLDKLERKERKRIGRWIVGADGMMHCSNCDTIQTSRIIIDEARVVFDMAPIRERMRFCPNCGADMRGEDDDEN